LSCSLQRQPIGIVFVDFELFKAKFTGGQSKSSSESWASSDLHSAMMSASDYAPVFIRAFWDGCAQIQTTHPEIGLPDADVVNQILCEHEVPYEASQPAVLARHPQPHILVRTQQKSLSQRAHELIHAALDQADRLLVEQRPRQAVQEILWIFETVSRAFQGQESGSGTLEGKYFNEIIRDLRKRNCGSTLAETLRWMNQEACTLELALLHTRRQHLGKIFRR